MISPPPHSFLSLLFAPSWLLPFTNFISSSLYSFLSFNYHQPSTSSLIPFLFGVHPAILHARLLVSALSSVHDQGYPYKLHTLNMAAQAPTGWTCCKVSEGGTQACGHWNNDQFATTPPKCAACSHTKCSTCKTKQPRPTVTSMDGLTGIEEDLAIQPASYPLPLLGSEGLNSRLVTDSAFEDGTNGVFDSGMEIVLKYTYSGRAYTSVFYSGNEFSSQYRRGWWRCGHCQNINNPDLAREACSICGHRRCGCCEELT